MAAGCTLRAHLCQDRAPPLWLSHGHSRVWPRAARMGLCRLLMPVPASHRIRYYFNFGHLPKALGFDRAHLHQPVHRGPYRCGLAHSALEMPCHLEASLWQVWMRVVKGRDVRLAGCVLAPDPPGPVLRGGQGPHQELRRAGPSRRLGLRLHSRSS